MLMKQFQVVEGDVYACLHKESEDVETHMSSVKEMVRENLKVIFVLFWITSFCKQ